MCSLEIVHAILDKIVSYRSFGNDHKTKIAEGFIDGDLVEQFLELPQNDMAEICKGIKVSPVDFSFCASVLSHFELTIQIVSEMPPLINNTQGTTITSKFPYLINGIMKAG